MTFVEVLDAIATIVLACFEKFLQSSYIVRDKFEI